MQQITIPQLSRQQFRELVKRITDLSDEMQVDSRNKVIECNVPEADLTALMKEVADSFGGLFPLDIVDRITPDTMELIRDSFINKFPKGYNDEYIVNDYFEGNFDNVLDHIYGNLTPHDIIHLHPSDQPEAYDYVFPTDSGYVCFHQLSNQSFGTPIAEQPVSEPVEEPILEDDEFETV